MCFIYVKLFCNIDQFVLCAVRPERLKYEINLSLGNVNIEVIKHNRAWSIKLFFF